MNPTVIVIGAGGHAGVVADALLAGGARVLGFTDLDTALHGRLRCGLPVLGGDAVLDAHDPKSVLLANGLGGIGANSSASARVAVQQRLQARGWTFCSVRHPSATVSPFALLEPGSQVMAAAVVQSHARVGTGSIVNTGAIVEHDVVLADWVHVAPGAVLCGDAQVGEGSHIGAGAVVRQGVRIGSGVVVGAGAAVVKDQAASATLAGVPARLLDRSR